MTTTDLRDITWSNIRDFDIDISLVNICTNAYGVQEYVADSADGTTRVVFGPVEDPIDGGTDGWGVTTYELVAETEGFGSRAQTIQHEQVIAQNYTETATACLALVRDMLA